MHGKRKEMDVNSLYYKLKEKNAKETKWMRIYLRHLYTEPITICELTKEQIQRCKHYLLDDLYDDDKE